MDEKLQSQILDELENISNQLQYFKKHQDLIDERIYVRLESDLKSLEVDVRTQEKRISNLERAYFKSKVF